MVRRLATLSVVFCLPLMVAGCTEPPSRSAVSDTLNRVSFQAPPRPYLPQPEDGATSPDAGTPPSRGGPEIYGLHPRLPVVPSQPTQTSAEGTTLNFDHADIREVLKVILGDVLNKPYTVDSQVQGEVTLSSTGALSNTDLLGILESVLRSNNATLINLGNSFEVVPLQNAVGRPEVDAILGRAPRVQPGFGLTIVPLRNISANAAAQFVQPLVAAPEDIRVDIGRNLLLFAGTGVERQAVVDTLADLDVNWLANKAVGLFPLQVTTPEAVIAELNGIFGSLDTSGAEAPLVRFLPIARLNAVLAVGTDNSQIQEVQRWITRLDRGKTVGTQFYVYNLKHAAADDTAKVLNDIFADQGNGLTSATNAAAPTPLGASTLAPSDTSPSVGETQGGAGSLGGGSGAVTGGEAGSQSLLPAPQQGAGNSGSGGGAGQPGGTKIVANRINNSLLIRATPEVYEEIESSLRRLDTAPLQVLIEATIAEVSLNDSLRYGVQYYIQAHNLRFGYSGQSNPRGEFGIEPNSTVPGFNFIFSGGGSNITIDALSQLTDVTVLSSPSVVVQDNSEATLVVGEQVPITTRQAISTDNTNAPFVNSIDYRNTGVILQVRPRINVDGVVTLEIGQEVSRVNQAATATDPTGLTPTITQRKITSRVDVQTGQTVVLGGLIQNQQNRGRSRIPIIGEIPVIGPLFGSTSDANQRSELIVFITPRVIRNAEDARDVSEELRSRLRSLQPTEENGQLPEGPPPVPNRLPPRQGPQRLSPQSSVIRPEAARVAQAQGVPPAWLPELAKAHDPSRPPDPTLPAALPPVDAPGRQAGPRPTPVHAGQVPADPPRRATAPPAAAASPAP